MKTPDASSEAARVGTIKGFLAKIRKENIIAVRRKGDRMSPLNLSLRKKKRNKKKEADSA